MSKINLRIISKPHAHLQSIVKTSVNFQKSQKKTVGGVAHTKYPLSIHFHYQNARKKNNKKKNCRSCAHKVHTPIGGRKDRHTDIRKDGKPKTMSLRFSLKKTGNRKIKCHNLYSNLDHLYKLFLPLHREASHKI